MTLIIDHEEAEMIIIEHCKRRGLAAQGIETRIEDSEEEPDEDGEPDPILTLRVQVAESITAPAKGPQTCPTN